MLYFKIRFGPIIVISVWIGLLCAFSQMEAIVWHHGEETSFANASSALSHTNASRYYSTFLDETPLKGYINSDINNTDVFSRMDATVWGQVWSDPWSDFWHRGVHGGEKTTFANANTSSALLYSNTSWYYSDFLDKAFLKGYINGTASRTDRC